MLSNHQDPTGFRIGDKVRLRIGQHAGRRGIICGWHDDQVAVVLDGGERLETSAENLTNFSLAARRAWEVMPKRAGRPRLSEPRTRMVSLRMDIEVWRMLSRAAEFGLIPNREQAVNGWLRERLVALLADGTPGGTASTARVGCASPSDADGEQAVTSRR